jgi:hypothetical protein
MNDGYLDADCVLTFFFNSGFLEAGSWKHDSRELYYPARFYRVEKRAIVSLEIHVIDKRHCVSKSSIRILSSRFALDFTNAFSECAINR